MRTLVILAVLFSSVSFAQAVGRRDGFPAPNAYATPSLSPPPPPRFPVIRSNTQQWRLEGRGYELRCDATADTCQTAMLRPKSGATVSGAQLRHEEAAAPWRGAEVAFRALLRTGSTQGPVRLVARVEDAAGNTIAQSTSDGLTGTTPFRWQTVTIAVPEQGERLVLAIELPGPGALFLRELQVDDAQLLASR